MKLAESGSRGVFWRVSPRGTQERKRSNGIRQRGDWWIRWTCPHSYLHRSHIGPKALAQREAERHRIERPCPQRIAKPTTWLLADVINEYVEAAKTSKRTWKEDQRYGESWKARFPGRTLEEVTAGEVEKVRAERLKGEGAVTPATVNRELAFLKHVYNLAFRDGRIDRNGLARLRLLREPSGRVRYLSDDEETELLSVLPRDEDRQRLLVLLNTGLRKSEFLGLRWCDVDFKTGILTIPRSKNGDTRHVPMNATVRDILGRRARSLDRTALVFANTESNRDLRWAQKTFPTAVAAAGIENFRLHDTRHTFASRLAMEGVDLLAIKVLGGWKTLSMVQRYAHLSPGHQRSAIERLANRQRVSEKVAKAGTE
jgi:integrase